MVDQATPAEASDNDIAIVGMAGRFPGANDVEQFWRRIAAGDDCLVEVDDVAPAAPGVQMVHRAGVLDDVAGFDPGFFGIGPRDGAVMDPQHRHFLECSWEALESAAIVPETFPGAIGVFGGCGMNTYLLNNLLTSGVLDQLGWFLLRHTGNDKDFFVNNVAYRLGLTGPAVNVQTACSTSLVAVHLAAQSLLSYECDLALAGGATIEVPHGAGYEYREGEILSPEGRCRAFDARSSGTVLTSGVGVVALRRRLDAEASGDPILAVIKGTAINNDGARKVSFLAPSVDGHADVVREALTVADLSARDLQLVEGHGTGTPVGDPIEVAALTEAHRTFTDAVGYCRLTSTKPNIGHLDTAAGVASLIKVVQALRHQTLPGLANHTAASPLIDVESSPFVISGDAAAWPSTTVRRAGVSSLGVGGTNAHVILEEAPAVEPDAAAPDHDRVFVLSARSREALQAASERLADRLEATDPAGARPDLDDVAHTLLRGRRSMPVRRVVAAADREQAVERLRHGARHLVFDHVLDADATTAPVGFMFPGGGAQYPSMGAGLDHRFDVFHDLRRQGIEMVRDLGGPDLAPLLAPGATDDESAASLRRADASLPAVFLTSVALARQAMDFGIRPDVLIGHSLGEYVAAHLAGVLSLEDALGLVVVRSQLMRRASGTDAAMLVVPLAEDEVVASLPDQLSVATVNAVDECVVAGRQAAIESYAAALEHRGVDATLIPLDAAAHSALLDPVLDEFREAVAGVRLSPPQIPYPSNLTGRMIDAAQATDPDYWVRHLRGTVRFADGLQAVAERPGLVLLELGPGHGLSSYARRSRPGFALSIPTLRHPDHDVSDSSFTLQAFARLWAANAPVDMERLVPTRSRQIVLPTYPFEHEHCWIEPGERQITASPGTTAAAERSAPATPLTRLDAVEAMMWKPVWSGVDVAAAPVAAPTPGGRWAILGDADDKFVDFLARHLERPLRLTGADDAAWADAEGTDPTDGAVGQIVIVAPVEGDREVAVHRWMDDLPRLVERAQQLGAALTVVTRSALSTADAPARRPVDALALGPVLVAEREYPDLDARLVDFDGSAEASEEVDALVELLARSGPRVMARRGVEWLEPGVERVDSTDIGDPVADGVVPGGRYLVTGGLGGVGHQLATHLLESGAAELIVVSSSALPSPSERDDWLRTHALDDSTSRRLRQLADLEHVAERAGGSIAVVVADLTDPVSIGTMLDDVGARSGSLDGAVHAAGVVDDRLMALSTLDDRRPTVDVKAGAALVLADELERRGASLLVLVSSTSTVLAPEGQAAYVAANSVLDSLAGRRGGLRIATMQYGLWAGLGVASDVGRRTRLGTDAATSVTHPIFTERLDHDDGSTSFVGRLSSAAHWVLDEHRTLDGVAILPGTGQIDLLVDATRLAGRDDASVEAILFMEPVVVPDDEVVTFRVLLGAATDPVIRLEVDDGVGWHCHTEGRLGPVGESIDAPSPSTAGDPVDRDPVARLRRHLRVGRRWDSLVSVHSHGDGRMSARLRLADDHLDDIGAWPVHPALLDVAIAVATLLDADDQHLYVPVGVGSVHARGALPADVTVAVQRLDDAAGRSMRVDLVVAGVDGAADSTPLVVLRDLELRAVDRLEPVADRHRSGVVDDGDVPLVLLADQLGLRPAEGRALFDRMLHGASDRVIGSSIDLDDLQRRMRTPASPAAGVDPASPTDGASSLENALRSLWSGALGVHDIGDHDDFFDLGGHSLIAIRLLSAVGRDFGARLQLSDLLDASTIPALAALIRATNPDVDARFLAESSGVVERVDGATPQQPPASTASPRIVTLSGSGDGLPMYIVHGAGGGVLNLRGFAREFSDERPVYGIQAHGVRSDEVPDASLMDMAHRYVDDLLEHGPGPYLLGGYSGGGIIALEMTKLLQERGHETVQVVLFDSVPSGRAFPARWERWRQVAGHARRTGFASIKPYLHVQASRKLDMFLLGHDGELPPLPADNEDYVDLFEHFTRLADAHPMGSYSVPVILVKADRAWPAQPHDYRWRAHLDDTIDIVNVPGDHQTMFEGDNAVTVADVVRARLIDRA